MKCVLFLLQIEHRSLTLGEILDGDRMAVSLYEIKFKETFERRELCTKSMTDKDLDTLKEAIEDLYYFEFIYGECSNILTKQISRLVVSR